MRSFWWLVVFGAGCDGRLLREREVELPVDADGDGSPESDDCDDTDATVFPGALEVPRDGVDNDCNPATCSGAGYEEVWNAWQLPATYGGEGATPFDEAASYASCSDGTPAHTLVDVTGEGALDLVVTFVCGDETTGDTRWLVHAGEEQGFPEVATEWWLPADYGEAGAAPFANALSAEVCGDGIPAHNVADLTGDGLPDLVITSDCDDDAVGQDHWLVHEGGADGFATAPTMWALPEGYGDSTHLPFPANSGAASCSKGLPSYTVADLTADGSPDLVVTESCSDTTVGTERWLVYPGEGNRFDAAIAWSLPVGVKRAAGSTSCGEGVVGHDTRDLDGDGWADLVVTETCNGDETVGDTRWELYRGGAAGFAATAAEWSLPSDYGAAGSTPFSSPEEVAAARDGTPGHQLIDLDGDGRLDLVITELPGDETVGTSRWTVHFGTDDGFEPAPFDWRLPIVFPGPAFAQPRDAADCAANLPAWTLTELDGNALPDVLVTASCDAERMGDTEWTVFPGSCTQ